MHAVREAGARAAATQHTVTETAHQRVLVARDEWTEAARRVEALDRLGERLRESEAVEAERVSNNEIDDLVLARRNVQLASARGAR